MKVGVLAITTAILLIAAPFAAIAGPSPDMDSDGTPDVQDFCKLNPSGPVPNGCDSDMDGYGNVCDSDYNDDGTVGLPDFGGFGAAFVTTGPAGTLEQDSNCDGTVGLPDFGAFGSNFVGPPGPSGLGCAGTVTCP